MSQISDVHFPKEQFDEASSSNINGYKYIRYDNGDIFIIDMSNADHSYLVAFVIMLFGAYNAGFTTPNEPMIVCGDTFHYSPNGSGVKISPDVVIIPNKNHVPYPTVPHSGPPPNDVSGHSHARIVVEIANHQTINSLTTKCRLWLQETYVRYVLGIKIHAPKDTRNSQGNRLRAMTARLWIQGAEEYQEDFGTIPKNTVIIHGRTIPTTGCTGPGLTNYTVKILIREVFYNPTNTVPAVYTPVIPAAFNIDPDASIDIDLYLIQQRVLSTQKQ
ncbi:15727_t:CDS:2 [Gigaspora margarita]|uniref:15727_t:CDS:1 n=1 Tax=Gigaspora margarita TaxID=4874 RepID=A0ABM8W344_GIGMA|nr:15727_t:CDS:2 [Gigaspora margarita]